jgi:hypothetical protein
MQERQCIALSTKQWRIRITPAHAVERKEKVEACSWVVVEIEAIFIYSRHLVAGTNKRLNGHDRFLQDITTCFFQAGGGALRAQK